MTQLTATNTMGNIKIFLLLAFVCGYTAASTYDISVVSTLDKNGKWKTFVDNLMDPRIPTRGSNIEVQRNIVQENGGKAMAITVSVKGNSKKVDKFYWCLQKRVPLKFNNAGAKNVQVYNDGKAVKRINPTTNEGFGGVLTIRPLYDNELFEVKFEKIIDGYSNSLGIGISFSDPKTAKYLSQMSAGTTMLYENQVYKNGNVIKRDYGPNLRTLSVGDRVGVMRRSNGDLHFFVNGADLGVAETGVADQIYGVVDVYGDAVEASLV